MKELHRRSEVSSAISSWAVVDYPSEVGGVSVSEAWADVITPSRCGAVEAVRVALAGTNRNLVSFFFTDEKADVGTDRHTTGRRIDAGQWSLQWRPILYGTSYEYYFEKNERITPQLCELKVYAVLGYRVEIFGISKYRNLMCQSIDI